MKYGYFDDARREYVITTPHTPYPWFNYLGTGDFLSLISHQAGGYCFHRDARLRRILRYRYNNIPTDMGGRYFYLREGGDVWTPSHMPMRVALDSFECRHGLGYSRITSRRNDVEVSLLFFVPLGKDAEVCEVRITNKGKAKKDLQLFSFVEWCLWNAQDDATNFQRNFSTGEVEVIDGGQTLIHKTEYRERRNHVAYYHVNTPVKGYDTDRDTFLGPWNGLDRPQVPMEGKSHNSVASGWSPIASHGLEISLAAGETRALVFVLGYIENPVNDKWEAKGVVKKDRLRSQIAGLASSAQVAQEMEKLTAHFASLVNRFQVKSQDVCLDRQVNIWNAYQCLTTFSLSRSASAFESGIGRGMGFRDSNQDLLSVVHMIPERVRERIKDIAATQKSDGSAYHQYQPLTKKGNNEIGSGFNDDPLWLILSTAAYVRETGDVAFLSEKVPFDGEKPGKTSLMDHLKASFNHVLENLGPHGLPLIGRADWNDCLNLNCFSDVPDEPFQTTGNREGRTAESTFIAGLFTYAGPEYAALCRLLGEPVESARALQAVEEMKKVCDQHGRDPEWFLRAYDFFGNKIGSKDNVEGQILIESQGMCVMGGMGIDDGFAKKALDSVKKRLFTPHGIVLNQPAYTEYKLEMGEITSYPPGYKENASVMCHNNQWVVMAEAMIGRGEEAFMYWSRIAPAYLEDVSDVHKTEPYVYAQMIGGPDAPRQGEAKNSWLTGTASWGYVAATQSLLGVRPEHDGLRVNPCIAKAVLPLTIVRHCRGADYEIRIKSLGEGPAKLTVNGKLMAGNVVPYAVAGSRVVIEVG